MKVLLYDGTFGGLLNVLYESFNYKKDEILICSKFNNIPLLGNEIINIDTKLNIIDKVENTIIDKINALCLKKIYMVYLSDHKNKEMLILDYLHFAFKFSYKVHSLLNIDTIRTVELINRMVILESHRFKGIIRFSYINTMFLYSSIEPDNDILELIANHFKKRFKNEYFLIHDLKREKAILYNKIDYEIIPFQLNRYDKLELYKDEYSLLWNTYFKSTTILERKNLKLQKTMLPERYWKHILEIQT